MPEIKFYRRMTTCVVDYYGLLTVPVSTTIVTKYQKLIVKCILFSYKSDRNAHDYLSLLSVIVYLNVVRHEANFDWVSQPTFRLTCCPFYACKFDCQTEFLWRLMRTQPKLFHLLRTALSAECKVDEDMDSASRVVRGHAVSVGADSKRKAVKI